MKTSYPIKSTKKYPSLHASTICESNGKLLVSCYGGEREGSKDSVILGTISDRNKKQWEEPKVWINVKNRAPANPRLFLGPNPKEIWLLAGVNYGKWCSGDTYLFFKRSTDYGKTWTDLELLTERKGLLGRINPYRNGDTWVIPLENEKNWSPVFMVSENNMRSWELVSPEKMRQETHLIQPSLVEVKKGKLLAYLRSQEGHIYKTESSNYGKEWSKPSPTSLPNNNSGIDMVKLKSGKLLLAYNPTTGSKNSEKLSDKWPEEMPTKFDKWGPRTPLRLSVSLDKGNSWTLHYDIEKGEGEYSYPTLTQTEDGKIHLVYTYNREAIKYVSFYPEELLEI